MPSRAAARKRPADPRTTPGGLAVVRKIGSLMRPRSHRGHLIQQRPESFNVIRPPKDTPKGTGHGYFEKASAEMSSDRSLDSGMTCIHHSTATTSQRPSVRMLLVLPIGTSIATDVFAISRISLILGLPMSCVAINQAHGEFWPSTLLYSLHTLSVCHT
jgi:hypothetical protein